MTAGKKLSTVILRDVTERMQAEEVRERLAAVVDSSDDAIISKDLNGIDQSWNRGAEKIFGYSASEAVGKPMLMLFPPERVQEESDILARIRRGESVEHFETVRVRKDGRRIDVSVTISPIRDPRRRDCRRFKNCARHHRAQTSRDTARRTSRRTLAASRRIAALATGSGDPDAHAAIGAGQHGRGTGRRR